MRIASSPPSQEPPMRPSKRILIGISTAVIGLGAASGIAVAAGGPGPGGPGGHGGRPPGAHAIGTSLGMTSAEPPTALQSGKTLAEIAKAKGKSVSGLED